MTHGFPCFGCYSESNAECQTCRRINGCMTRTFNKGERAEASA